MHSIDPFIIGIACCGGGDICLVGEELGKCLPKVLLILNELLDGPFPIHC